MADGMHDVRTPFNHSFELDGDSEEGTTAYDRHDFDEIYRDIVWLMGSEEDAEEAHGGVIPAGTPGPYSDAYISAFLWDDFRNLDPGEGGFAASTTFDADMTTAGPGMKDENPIEDWTCVPANNLGGKFDLRQVYL